jgi:hypothetical protein
MKKIFSLSIFVIITISAFSQEKIIGNWLSVGYLEASKIKMFDIDSSYIDTTIYNYRTSPIFIEIENNVLKIISCLPLKNNKTVETKFQLEYKNDTAKIFENNVQNGFIVHKNELLEMKVFSVDGLLNRTHFYVKNNKKLSSKLNLKKIRNNLINNKWHLCDLKSNQLSSQIEVIFTDENELSIANPYGISVSDYKLIEYDNEFFIIFENEYASNFMKIVDVSDDFIIIEMPVNKVFEQFKLKKE